MKGVERVHPARILQTRTGFIYMFVLAPHKLRTKKKNEYCSLDNYTNIFFKYPNRKVAFIFNDY